MVRAIRRSSPPPQANAPRYACSSASNYRLSAPPLNHRRRFPRRARISLPALRCLRSLSSSSLLSVFAFPLLATRSICFAHRVAARHVFDLQVLERSRVGDVARLDPRTGYAQPRARRVARRSPSRPDHERYPTTRTHTESAAPGASLAARAAAERISHALVRRTLDLPGRGPRRYSRHALTLPYGGTGSALPRLTQRPRRRRHGRRKAKTLTTSLRSNGTHFQKRKWRSVSESLQQLVSTSRLRLVASPKTARTSSLRHAQIGSRRCVSGPGTCTA